MTGLDIDVVLHESGWFDRFLADRGRLLPDDEAPLARAWTLVERLDRDGRATASPVRGSTLPKAAPPSLSLVVRPPAVG